MPQDPIVDLTGQLYAAVGRPDLWQPWFEGLCRALRAPTGALILRFEWGTGHRGHFAVGIGDEFHGPQYVGQLAADLPLYEKVLASEPGDFFVLSEPPAFLASRFYEEWLRPQGLQHVLGGIVHRTPKHVTGLGVIRPPDIPFEDADLDLLHGLAPHLQRAIHLQEMLTTADLVMRAASQALDALRLGALLVDEHASVLASNRRAEALLAEDGGLRCEDRQLIAPTRQDTEALRRLVDGATREPAGKESAAGGMLAISRGDDTDPLMTVVSPLKPAETPAPWSERSAAIVLMSDPEELPRLPEAGLRRLYGLTPAEARVAARLAQGERLEAIAEALDVRLSTVRSQLQAILAKTGTQRQSELVRLLLGGPAAIVGS
jgi:DNA-binding CsgD family transcriptional regulator